MGGPDFSPGTPWQRFSKSSFRPKNKNAIGSGQLVLLKQHISRVDLQDKQVITLSKAYRNKSTLPHNSVPLL